jgi:large subunit ribosomal protein L6
MSRIGKKVVSIPDGVTASIDGQVVHAKGPKGELTFEALPQVTLAMSDGGIQIQPVNESKQARSTWGLTRTMIQNIVSGVSTGFEKKLEINGVGYRAEMQGKNIKLALGFSHDVIHVVPDDITVQVPKPTEIVVSGINKQRVGEVAAKIRKYRPPEPYKGKGVKYADEYIFRKEGKKK